MEEEVKVKKWGNSGGIPVSKKHIGKTAKIKIEDENETRED